MKERFSNARGVFSICAVVLMLLAASPAIANTDYTVLLDLDNNSSTGCTATTTAGTFAGADQRLTTTVTNASPLMVVAVTREVCVAGPSTWGAPIAVNSPYAPPWAVGEHLGTGGLDVIETYFPLTGIPHGFYRLGFSTSAGAGDALLTVDGTPTGAAILIGNFAPGEIPTLSEWMLIVLALSLGVVGFFVTRAPRAFAILLAVLVLVTAGAGVAWATLTPDGNPSGWSGIAPLATRTPVPPVGSSKIAAVFGTIVNDVLLLRIDADVPRSISVTAQPANTTVAAGSNASFTSTASGSPTPTVQWQVSTDGVTFTNIPGATSTTLTFTTTAADNNKQYRAVFTNSAGSVNSNAGTLSIATLPVVTSQPASTTVASGSSASFTSTASGSPSPTVQWQVSTDGVTFNNIAGATSTTLTFTATGADNNKQYRAVFTNIAGSVNSNAATLSIATLPVVTTQPVNTTVAAGSSASFTSTASGSPSPTVQWQVSTDGGGTFNNIAGATSTTLTFTATAADDLKQYRAVFTNIAGSATSNPATLFIATLPVVTTQPVNTTVPPNTSASFTLTATASPAPTVQWQVSTDGVSFTDVPGATSTTLTFTATAADHTKQYRAVFTNIAGSVASDPAFLFVVTSTVASIPFSDSFTNTPDGQLSSSWTVRNGNYRVTTNQAMAATPRVNLATLNGLSSTTADVQVDVVTPLGGFAALVARYGGPVDTNMYYAGVRNTGGTFTAEIWKNVGGTATQLATQTVATGTGTLRFTVVGTSLTLRVNGTTVATATDSSIPGAGGVGMRATQGVVFDNFFAN